MVARPINLRGGRPKADRSSVERWLTGRLKDGPVEAAVLLRAARKARIKEPALRIAKRRLGILSRQENRVWVWEDHTTNEV